MIEADTKILILQEDSGKRLDIFVSEKLDKTRSYIKTLVEKSEILVNDNVVKAGYILKLNDNIFIKKQEQINTDLKAQDIAIEIVYEDDDLAVVNKPKGMTVHPGGGATEDTLANALLFHLSSLSTINGTVRPGIVHRLDKDTSGLLIVAKNDKAHLSLSTQLSERKVEKIYTAILEGVLEKDSGVIKTRMERDSKNRKLMCVTNNINARDAISNYKVLKRFANYTYAEFNIITGRTHQIRVHAKHIKHPIVGDKSYGYKKQKFNLSGQLLHAKSITFTHPTHNKSMTFTIDEPQDFKEMLTLLEKTGDK